MEPQTLSPMLNDNKCYIRIIETPDMKQAICRIYRYAGCKDGKPIFYRMSEYSVTSENGEFKSSYGSVAVPLLHVEDVPEFTHVADVQVAETLYGLFSKAETSYRQSLNEPTKLDANTELFSSIFDLTKSIINGLPT